MDSDHVKQEVIKQVRTQYAMTNARELIEVHVSRFVYSLLGFSVRCSLTCL